MAVCKEKYKKAFEYTRLDEFSIILNKVVKKGLIVFSQGEYVKESAI